MKTDLYKLLIIFCIVFLFTSCSQIGGSPEAIYNSFRKACESGDLTTAEAYVTSRAILENQTYGTCFLLPDGVYNLYKSDWAKVNDLDPKVEINEDRAFLSWWWESGEEYRMTMVKVHDDWMIDSALVYSP